MYEKCELQSLTLERINGQVFQMKEETCFNRARASILSEYIENG